ncbi:MAG: HD domain-containing protein, partial [Chloroflexi bacterium]|nr:HD domain-containing protein [Chloroflexota bacterium]
AGHWLNREQMKLFMSMQPGEQAHSLSVMKTLLLEGEPQPDLMAAALLHDVGKTLHPLHTWERIIIVLFRAAAPSQARRWGQGGAHGWRRAFAVAEQHPAWGAELALAAGASAQTADLIRRHQEACPPQDGLLRRLQRADGES